MLVGDRIAIKWSHIVRLWLVAVHIRSETCNSQDILSCLCRTTEGLSKCSEKLYKRGVSQFTIGKILDTLLIRSILTQYLLHPTTILIH